MSITYNIGIYTPDAIQVQLFQTFLSCVWSRTVNRVGRLTLVLPYDPTFVVDRDSQIRVWRSVNGMPSRLVGQTIWFVCYREVTRTTVTLQALDAISLLKRRIVAYSSGTSQASKTDQADDMLKAIVRENLSTSATDTARRIATTLLTVQADVALGPSISKSFSRDNVLEALNDIAAASNTAGTYLAYDIVKPDDATPLEFRTYVNWRGVDHRYTSSSPLVLSEARGNLAEAQLVDDWREESNYIYAGGQGEGAARNIEDASDSTLIGASPYARIEKFRNATHVPLGNSAQLQAEADAELRLARPKRIFTGRVVDTPSTQFGINYDFGDYITIYFQGMSFDCRLDSIAGSISQPSSGNAQESIDCQLRVEA